MEEYRESDMEISQFEEDEEASNLHEEEERNLHKEITEIKSEFQENVGLFKDFFLKDKDNIYQTLLIEIESIFQEYEHEHYNSLVLYCGRVFEFIIYQVGWLILKDAMYKFQYVSKTNDGNIKTFSEIINEIRGFLKLNTGSDHKKTFIKYRKYISDKRNDVAHPSYHGDVRNVEPTSAKETLRYLLNSFDFLISKFEEIFEMDEPPNFRTIEHVE